MSPSFDPRWDRLPHLFAGELPEDEARELAAWIDATAERRDVVARLREVWSLAAEGPRAWDAEAGLAVVRQRTGTAGGRVIARVDRPAAAPAPAPAMPPRRSARRWPTIGIAAAAAAAAIVATATFVTERFEASRPSAAVALAEYRTRAGERLSLRLSDGTLVTLAPASVLRMSPSYGRRDRTVALDGDAEFVVTHDAARPFAVHTAAAIARDLGTRFVVRGRSVDSVTEVAVAEGEVAVGRRRSSGEATPFQQLASDSVVATPGVLVRLRADSAPLVNEKVNLDPYFAWTRGELVFDKTPLADVARQLSRWHGAEVRVSDRRTAQRRLTASFHDEPIAVVLDRIASALDLDVRTAGRTLILQAR